MGVRNSCCTFATQIGQEVLASSPSMVQKKHDALRLDTRTAKEVIARLVATTTLFQSQVSSFLVTRGYERLAISFP